jgi:hypothetical protein
MAKPQSCGSDACNSILARMAGAGHGRKTNHVRDDGSFHPKRSPDAGDGCTADHCQPGSLLAAELAPIADAGAGDPGICNGKALKFVLRTALRPNQIEFSHRCAGRPARSRWCKSTTMKE